MSGRHAAVGVLPAVIVAALVTGCTAFGTTGSRGPVSLAGWDLDVIGETTLALTIPSCDGDPELASLVQGDGSVTVEVITTVHDVGPACAEVLRVHLDEPLGDREVIDAVSGEALRINARY
jgi:hypothetical protein